MTNDFNRPNPDLRTTAVSDRRSPWTMWIGIAAVIVIIALAATYWPRTSTGPAKPPAGETSTTTTPPAATPPATSTAPATPPSATSEPATPPAAPAPATPAPATPPANAPAQ